MNERIKEIRKDLGLNQQEFGERIGLKTSTIAGYETGTRTPNGAVIQTICRVFHVSKEWLVNGTGPKHVENSAMFTELLSAVDDSDDQFIRAFIETYLELDKASRDVLEYTVMKLSSKMKK